MLLDFATIYAPSPQELQKCIQFFTTIRPRICRFYICLCSFSLLFFQFSVLNLKPCFYTHWNKEFQGVFRPAWWKRGKILLLKGLFILTFVCDRSVTQMGRLRMGWSMEDGVKGPNQCKRKEGKDRRGQIQEKFRSSTIDRKLWFFFFMDETDNILIFN